MNRGRLAQYGLARTTFTGNVEREDAQPNEGLHHSRTAGPPTVKVAPTPASTGNWIPLKGHKRGRGGYHKSDARATQGRGYSRNMAETNANTSGPSTINRGRKWGNNFLEPADFPPALANTQPSGSRRQRQEHYSDSSGSRYSTHKRQKQNHEIEALPRRPDPIPIPTPTLPQRPAVPPLPFRPRKNQPHTQSSLPLLPSRPPTASLPPASVPNSQSPSRSNEIEHAKPVIPPLPSRPSTRKPTKAPILQTSQPLAQPFTMPSAPTDSSLHKPHSATLLTYTVKSEPMDFNLNSISTSYISHNSSSYNAVKRENDEPLLAASVKHPNSAPIPQVKPETSPAPSSLSSLTPLPTPEVTPAFEPNPTVTVKPEPIEAKPLGPERRLVTSALKRFPLPDDCRSDQPNYRERRHAFHKEQVMLLRRKGLIVGKKALFREDGMVLEWSSRVPVWDDTFEPEDPLPSTPEPRARTRTPMTPGAVDLVTALNAAARENAEISVRSLKRRRVGIKAGNQHSQSPSPGCFSQPMMPPSISDSARASSTPLPVSALATATIPPVAAEPGPSETVEDQGELEERPQKIIRPSQVIPPNPHPPKRTFKPVHPPPRPGKHADTHESGTTTRRPRSSAPPAPFKKPPPSVLPTREATAPAITMPLQTSHGRLAVLKEQIASAVSPSSAETSTSSTRAASCDVVESYLVSPFGGQPKLPGIIEPQPQPSPMLDVDLQQPTPAAHGADVDHTMEKIITDMEGRQESEDEEEGGVDIMELAEEFLCRYLKMFDTNRTQLRSAYTPDATFNIRTNRAPTTPTGEGRRTQCLADLFCQDLLEERSAMTYQDCDRIVERLCALGSHKFLPEAGRGYDQAEPVFDLVARSIPSAPLGSSGKKGEEGLEVFLVAFHGEAVQVDPDASSSEVAKEHVVSVDQSFVLRIPDASGDHDDNDSDLWPLKVMSHQMVVRDGPMLRQDRVEELVPWIRQTAVTGQI